MGLRKAEIDSIIYDLYRLQKLKPDNIKLWMNRYSSESVDQLVKKLETTDELDTAQVAICILLGKKGTVKAKEGLGKVIAFGMIDAFDGRRVTCPRVSATAEWVLQELGSPAPQSLIDGLTYPSNYDQASLRSMANLVVKIGGAGTLQRLKKALKEEGDEKICRRLEIIIRRIEY